MRTCFLFCVLLLQETNPFTSGSSVRAGTTYSFGDIQIQIDAVEGNKIMQKFSLTVWSKETSVCYFTVILKHS